MSVTLHFQIGGMHCASCALLIDDVLEDLPGVHATKTTAKPPHTTVEVDTSLTHPDEVVAAIDELGYQAMPITDGAP